ncbi:histidine kinase-, DNA gyrase B-, and HSP90-like ATPase family protein [Collimonas arenae]|uniref:Histidine kinase-, DNA gyrase B-, and HSP90-like ATPase family protein n=1 Tax=Collimonas arenae TaxID=279058 RepID=A0A127PTL2_9BURK|nr:histidine kinase [Collimonas arenae]AMP01117.1 histidine kinase-, DNA gyrase B-, and HSP90-like ATPase family protein [Collimonas arenae]AMP11014.1 histidine kinase-, DNA gyrase B-, and HSP90-like ATPase family protein [Collimonas arenae]
MKPTAEIALPQNTEPLARRLLRAFYLNLGIDIICAVIVTYVMRISDSFWVNLVFSLCIGMSAMVLIEAGRVVFWRNSTPRKAHFLAFILVAAGIAQFLGIRLADLLLGLPTDNFSSMYMNVSGLGLIILTVSVCVGATLFFWNLSTLAELRNQAAIEKARATAIEKQALQAQLQMLQAQIEPHMLFNTLATLQSLIAIDAPRAQQMLDQLIQFLRASLSSSRIEQTTLAQEFSLMEAYLELMSLRMGSRLSFDLQLPAELRDTVIAPMLLQPLVENAIKHGLEPKIEGGRVEVAASRQGEILLLDVSDTGLGLSAQSDLQPNNHASHIGLSNIHERLQALYGSRASLTVKPKLPHGVIAQLQLPILT